jgi:hypothetical protein
MMLFGILISMTRRHFTGWEVAVKSDSRRGGERVAADVGMTLPPCPEPSHGFDAGGRGRHNRG